MHKEAQRAAGGPTYLGATSEERAHPQLSSGSNPSVLVDKTKSVRDGLKTANTDSDDPIIVTYKSEEEEANKEDTHNTSHDVPKDNSVPPPSSPKSAQIQVLMAQLTTLLVTSLNPELSKLLASHNFASCLPTELKELPLKFTKLSGEIKKLKQHVKDMEIELPGDLEILIKLETFTSTISSLTSQKQLKTLDSLPSLLNKVTKTLNRFATVVENASEATTKDVPSAGQATALPAEREKNTKDAETNLKDELVDLLGTNVVTQYYNKKLLIDKYCDKMLKRKKSPKITNCKVLTKKGPITLKIYREDGSGEVISNLKVSDLHLAEWREVIQACLDKSEKGWKTIYDLKLKRVVSLLEGLQGGKKIALCQKE
ncbi:hypothetical protein Tco_1009231 [Tanacetum coccineum]